jgi:hypothetical protein
MFNQNHSDIDIKLQSIQLLLFLSISFRNKLLSLRKHLFLF